MQHMAPPYMRNSRQLPASSFQTGNWSPATDNSRKI
jgi:hypothetical protein